MTPAWQNSGQVDALLKPLLSQRHEYERFVMENDVLGFLINRRELEGLEGKERTEAIGRIAQGLRQLVLSSARFRCTNCGYSSQKLIWHCPSCKHWESVRPIQHFQLESLVRRGQEAAAGGQVLKAGPVPMYDLFFLFLCVLQHDTT